MFGPVGHEAPVSSSSATGLAAFNPPSPTAPPSPPASGMLHPHLHHFRSASSSSVVSSASSASSSLRGANGPRQRGRSVSFYPEVLVAATWAPEDYDRQSTEVTALTHEDILEVIQFRRDMRRETAKLELSMLRSQMLSSTTTQDSLPRGALQTASNTHGSLPMMVTDAIQATDAVAHRWSFSAYGSPTDAYPSTSSHHQAVQSTANSYGYAYNSY